MIQRAQSTCVLSHTILPQLDASPSSPVARRRLRHPFPERFLRRPFQIQQRELGSADWSVGGVPIPPPFDQRPSPPTLNCPTCRDLQLFVLLPVPRHVARILDPGEPIGPHDGLHHGEERGQGRAVAWHVTAVTVAPEFRRLGLARQLMDQLEDTSINLYAYFVDLFVRAPNARDLHVPPVRLRGHRQASAHRRRRTYDMRKSTATPEKRASVPSSRPVRPGIHAVASW